MIEAYYLVTFLASLLLTGVYMFLWRKHYDVHLTLVYALVPVINLGYFLLSMATTQETALAVNKLSYLGGCFLQMIIMLAIFSLCQIRVNRWLKVLFMLVGTVVYLSALTGGSKPWFYRQVFFERLETGYTLIKEYGVMHTVFYAMVFVYFTISVGTILYAFLRKNQVSRRILTLLFLPEVICMISFFAGRKIVPQIELIPAAYVFAQVFYLAIAYRISLYDVSETAIDTMVKSGGTGFVTFDLHERYLGSNDTAKQVFPELNELTVDRSLRRSRALWELFSPWLNGFDAHPEDTEKNRHFYEKDDRIYLVTVEWLAGKKRQLGYLVYITDDTLDRAYINLLDGYNSDLEKQVEEKTAHITEMHDNLVLSMATMVESRDNSTGGHIRRTSEGVRLLTNAMKALPQPPEGYPMSESFFRNLIKAAPMHDLGKIAVDDKILRKPGRFEPEEFEIMKTHAAEGARIVHEILKATDDDAFHLIAENVAHYHHERWDGSGYPKGLKGKEIPPEARIMAVADVYDALVSKRVYKESMSFEKADAIILNGMGSQFDPALKSVYLAAKLDLEAYYAKVSVL